MLTVDMLTYDFFVVVVVVCFFFKYGVVRNRVSSSKSQANATQSAIDEGGV